MNTLAYTHARKGGLSAALLTALLSSVLLLAGCKKGADKPEGNVTPSATASTSGVSTDAIAKEARGFTVGSPMSARTVYVFFDPQCPHCAVLWDEAKPLKSQAKFVWIPVGLLNGNSTSQGAALLAASDPAAAMDAHEASMKAKQGGILATGDLDTQKAAITANTKLMDKFQFNSVPTIVANHASTGVLVVREGALPTAQLAEALGLKAPGN